MSPGPRPAAGPAAMTPSPRSAAGAGAVTPRPHPAPGPAAVVAGPPPVAGAAAVPLARLWLRPVPWAWLALLVAGWVPLARLAAAAPADPELGVTAFRLAAVGLGLGAAVLAAPETDPPRDLLRAVPVPRWVGLAVRLAGWLVLGVPAVVVAAAWVDGTGGWPAADLVRAALPGFLLMTAVCFLAAGPTSVLGGGGAGLAAVLASSTAARTWPERFPIQLLAVPGDPGWPASQPWTVATAATLVAAALALEHRAGTRLAPPSLRTSPSARATRIRPGP
jgi:hypothetical protein